MDLIFNDLSIHGQFYDVQEFGKSIGTIQAMRSIAKRHELDIHCNRGVLSAEPISGIPISQAVAGFSREKQRSIMSWLTNSGPFWDDLRKHGSDDYLDCRGEVVTDSGVGEAAFRTLSGTKCTLVSCVPSNWDYAPVEVVFRKTEDEVANLTAMLLNWRSKSDCEEGFAEEEPPVSTWKELESKCSRQFSRLHFAEDAFAKLSSRPFVKSAAGRLFFLLGVIDQRAREFELTGVPTKEAHRIERNFFSGANALFTDSSETEKREFQDQLTFPHPAKPQQSIFCPWHGKERRLTLRIHFSWPIRHDEPVYIVHVGPKITKR